MQGKQMDAAERSVDMTMHVAGMAFCLRASLVLMVQAAMSGAGLTVAAATVYVLGMVVMFGFSAACHLCPHGRWKEIMRASDHATIFVMIAGSYTRPNPVWLFPRSIFGRYTN